MLVRNPPAWTAPDPSPGSGHWLLRARVFEADDLKRAVTRIAHEIVERNHGAEDVVLVGLYTRGVIVARRLAAAIASFEGVEVPVGALDVSFYRDDIALRRVSPLGPTQLDRKSTRLNSSHRCISYAVF